MSNNFCETCSGNRASVCPGTVSSQNGRPSAVFRLNPLPARPSIIMEPSREYATPDLNDDGGEYGPATRRYMQSIAGLGEACELQTAAPVVGNALRRLSMQAMPVVPGVACENCPSMACDNCADSCQAGPQTAALYEDEEACAMGNVGGCLNAARVEDACLNIPAGYGVPDRDLGHPMPQGLSPPGPPWPVKQGWRPPIPKFQINLPGPTPPGMTPGGIGGVPESAAGALLPQGDKDPVQMAAVSRKPLLGFNTTYYVPMALPIQLADAAGLEAPASPGEVAHAVLNGEVPLTQQLPVDTSLIYALRLRELPARPHNSALAAVFFAQGIVCGITAALIVASAPFMAQKPTPSITLIAISAIVYLLIGILHPILRTSTRLGVILRVIGGLLVMFSLIIMITACCWITYPSEACASILASVTGVGAGALVASLISASISLMSSKKELPRFVLPVVVFAVTLIAGYPTNLVWSGSWAATSIGLIVGAFMSLLAVSLADEQAFGASVASMDAIIYALAWLPAMIMTWVRSRHELKMQQSLPAPTYQGGEIEADILV